MTRTTALVAAILPALASAHFSILYPPTAFVIAGEENKTPPCGYGTPPDPSITPHPFLISGSQIALSTHGEADWDITYTLGDPSVGNATWTDLYPDIETEGDGNFCIPNARANVATTTEGGTRGWISVKAEMAEGTYYQCAYVSFVNVATLEFPLVCANSTGVKVEYRNDGDDDDDDDTSTTSKTSTSTKYTNSTTTKTTTGLTSTDATTTTLTGTNTSPTFSMPSPTDDDDDDDDATPTPNPPAPTDTTPPPPTDQGPSTITSTSTVAPTDNGESPAPTGTGTTSVPIAVPTGAAAQTKGSPLGMPGFAAVVFGAGILCAGLLA